MDGFRFDLASTLARELHEVDKLSACFPRACPCCWAATNRAAPKKARANLKGLRKQQNEVADWYGSLKTSSAGAWAQAKKGFSDAYKALGDARKVRQRI